ncbi:MAG: PAS domain S-box protein [Spirochaetales bacterium]|nr:PAS domain S-box protein [Spirochaetales bacterium]
MEPTFRLETTELFRAIFEASPEMELVTTADGAVVVEVNAAFVATSGWSRSEALGRTVDELRLWEDPRAMDEFRSRLRRDGSVRGLEAVFRLKDGSLRRLELSASVADSGGVRYVVTRTLDVTGRHELEERLRKYAFLLERAEEMAKIGSWEFDYATKAVTGTEGAARIYGVPRDNLSVEDMETIPLPEYRPLLNEARDSHIREGKPYDIEFRVKRRSDGAILDVRSKAHWDPANKRLFGILRDITEERRTEQGLREALAAREVLISELFHRINNTLQLIVSMLLLEKGRESSCEAARLSARMVRRVRTIALAHAHLYDARSLARVALGAYLPRLVSEGLGEELVSSGARLEFSVEGIELLIDAVVPVGLIVSELVGNALEHAFPAGRPGGVRVEARRGPEGACSISVSDDGPGAPGGPVERLGLSMVRNLAEGQLRGSVSFGGPPGFTCVVSFRDDFLRERVPASFRQG